jgi:hypothetical protein
MNVYEAIDMGAFPRREDAGKNAEPIIRAEPRSDEDAETARERILDQHYGPRRTGLDFDREGYNRRATELDQEFSRRVAERSAAEERDKAQSTLDSLRQNGRGSSSSRAAYKRFER